MARTHRVMYPCLISVSAIDFCPQLACTGSSERSNCGRLAQGFSVQVRKSGSRLALAIRKVETAWPRQRAPDTQGISGGQVSLGRTNKACTALSLSDRLTELTLSQLTWYKSPFTFALTEHSGANPFTAGIYSGCTVHYCTYLLLLLLSWNTRHISG